MYSCGHWISRCTPAKADSLDALEGSGLEYVKASIQSHRRGLRSGHLFTG